MFPIDLSQRNKYILDQVKNNNYEINWIPIMINHNGNEVIIQVFGDALKVDGVRVNVSAKMQQEIADMVGGSLITQKVADLIYQNAMIKIQPFPQPITTSTDAMIGHSKKIDNQIIKLYSQNNITFDPTIHIVSNTGKHWLLDNKITKSNAVNYGWFVGSNPWQSIKTYSTKIPGVFVVQPLASVHNSFHVDYSQVCVLMKNVCLVNGVEVEIEEVLKHDDLYGSICCDKLKVFRQI